MSARVELYKDEAARHRWRFVKNGNIMADSGQGYSRRIDCLTGCATVLGGVFHSDAVHRSWDAADPDEWDRDHSIPVRDLTRRATAAGRAS